MKQAIQLGAFSAANIVVAFLFQWYVLSELGAGMETDAFFAGTTLPQLVLAVISGSLMHVLVPLLAGEDANTVRRDAWGMLVLVGGIFGLLATILHVTAPWWIPMIFPGFSHEGVALTVSLTRIQLISMVFSAISGVQWAAYHARQQFLWAEFSPILSSLLGLLLLFWALPRFGIVAAAWINTFQMCLQTILLAPGMGKPVRPNLSTVAVQNAWQRIKPLLWGAAYFKTEPLFDRFLLSTAGSGSLSLFYLAQQIYGAVNQVLNKTIAAPLVPLLSKLHKAGDYAGFRLAYCRKLIQIGAISTAGVLLLCLFGLAVLDLLIGHGNISAANVAELWWMMLWLGGMFIGGAMGQISSSAFYASGDTLTPMRTAVIPYTIFIPSKLAAYYIWGVAGLALATSIYYLLSLSLQIYLLEKKQTL